MQQLPFKYRYAIIPENRIDTRTKTSTSLYCAINSNKNKMRWKKSQEIEYHQAPKRIRLHTPFFHHREHNKMGEKTLEYYCLYMKTSNPNTNLSTKQPASKPIAHTKKSNHRANLTSQRPHTCRLKL
jgi:hypothetical protein